MDASIKIYSNEGVVSASVQIGTTLLELCDQQQTAIIFGCRKGKCGACMIRVIEGGENLSEQGHRERDVLDVLAPAADRRLACQCTVLGDVTIEVAD